MGYDSVILVADYFTRRVGGFSSEKLEASFRATVTASLKAYGVATGERGKFSKHCFFHSVRRSHRTGVGRRKLDLDPHTSPFEVFKHFLAVYVPHAGRRARDECSFHGQGSVGRRVPPSERFASQRIK